jgi:hypothetical protein
VSYPLVTIAELKTYLGITGAQDDSLLASVASNASIIAERETGRTFAVSSNVTRIYSTDGQAALIVHDMPMSDGTRVVRMDGTDLVADSGYWLLPDRRNPDVGTTIQLRHFSAGWNRWSFNWFDGNYDSPRYQAGRGTPNDLSITGVVGHPTLPLDVFEAVRALAALLFWRAKAGASGIVTTPLGDEVDVSVSRPRGWEEFVEHWRIRTAVVAT